MESIHVDVDSLIALGGVCRREADALGVADHPRQAGPPFQATTAVTEEIAAIVGRTDGLISVRLQVTGHKFATAAEMFGMREAKSRQEITTLGHDVTLNRR